MEMIQEFFQQNVVFVLVWMHFLMDFVFQTNDMAINKSKSNKWLLVHVIVYTSPFFFFGIPFALINGISHFLVDYVTSRINSKMWAEKKVHYFFIGVGFDQACHMTVLLLTARYLLYAI